MLDDNAYRTLLSENTEPDLIPRLRDPALLARLSQLEQKIPEYQWAEPKGLHYRAGAGV